MSAAPFKAQLHYPDSDGNPMADNTIQYNWMVKLKENIDFLLSDDPQVFVAANLLWYPVEGRPELRRAPDVMVAFGRPKGNRGSYRPWEEGGIAPQVVIEVLSPGNTPGEMARKLRFYDQYGVEEYCQVDPNPNTLSVSSWQRQGEGLVIDAEEDRWQSPRLGITIAVQDGQLVAQDPAGQPFLSVQELYAQYAEQQKLNQEQAEALQAKDDEIARLRAELDRLKGQ